jgi:hypothetical protein
MKTSCGFLAPLNGIDNNINSVALGHNEELPMLSCIFPFSYFEFYHEFHDLSSIFDTVFVA